MDSAKELAEAKGVSLAGIEGTGKDGRVTRADVARAIAEGRRSARRNGRPPPPPWRFPAPGRPDRARRKIGRNGCG